MIYQIILLLSIKIVYHVPSIFQIWERRDIEREVPKKHKPINKFVKKTEHPDISFRQLMELRNH